MVYVEVVKAMARNTRTVMRTRTATRCSQHPPAGQADGGHPHGQVDGGPREPAVCAPTHEVDTLIRWTA